MLEMNKNKSMLKFGEVICELKKASAVVFGDFVATMTDMLLLVMGMTLLVPFLLLVRFCEIVELSFHKKNRELTKAIGNV